MTPREKRFFSILNNYLKDVAKRHNKPLSTLTMVHTGHSINIQSVTGYMGDEITELELIDLDELIEK